MRCFQTAGTFGRVAVEIDENVLRATVREWAGDLKYEVILRVPNPFAGAISTIEAFSWRPGFDIDYDELEHVDEDGEHYDAEDVLKLYDNAHGGRIMWTFQSTNDVIWGIARGTHAVLAEGTIWYGDPVTKEWQSEGPCEM